jgi:hypothetical protein
VAARAGLGRKALTVGSGTAKAKADGTIALEHGPDQRLTSVVYIEAFRAATEKALHGKGVQLRWIDTLRSRTSANGETHCYTDVVREPGALSTWWKANSA